MAQAFRTSTLAILTLALILGAGPALLAGQVARHDGATVTLTGKPGERTAYDLRLVVPANARRSFQHEERVQGSVTFDADGKAVIDLSAVVEQVPGWNAAFDAVEIAENSVVGPEIETAPPVATGGPIHIETSARPVAGNGSSPSYHIERNVPGPEFDGLGNSAEDYTVDHHVFVVENTRSSATENSEDGDSLNTGGIAIVLHNDGNDDLSVLDLGAYDINDHVLNTINRNDHFLTFFREDADGVQDVVGRVEGLSFWDMGEINQELIDFFADSGHLPWNWMDLNVTFNPPSEWLDIQFPTLSHSGATPTFSRGNLPWLAFNNLSCENNANEVCLDLPAGVEVDMSFYPGTKPNIGWGYLDDPFMGLSLDGGSISGTPPIEFGSPFLEVNGDAANDFAADLEDFFGSTAPIAFEMKTNPVGFAAKYLFALRGGVTYESGSGDYAEWLERLDLDEELQAGEIVGVHGGKVTHRTDGADHAMVVSYKPIVLGNMPSKDRQDRFEKVAFMGQTLVKVVGTVNKGDYILPSGKNDGHGVAIAPSDIRADQLAGVVGIAWGSGGVAGRLGLVNVAVGLRPVEVTKVIARQQASLDELRDEYSAAKLEIARLQDQVGTMEAALTQIAELRGQVEALLASRVADSGR